jgi:EAL domain-containing protein (putative c-di-GMP-specific phosphodiesterase class I)/CHASE2 domain-containing sensor protein/GGDEF domain-containing protein
LHRRYRKERWFAAIVILVLSGILFVTGSLEPVEHRLSEVRARLLDRPPTGTVAIVEVDAKSIHAINSWPWSRRYHAALVDRLGVANVAMIAFDVDFSAHSDAAGDAAFGRSLRKVEPVILPIFQQRASAVSGDMIKSRPADPFGSAWVGGVNIIPGLDGVVRDFPAATTINGQVQPSMAALIADNSQLGDRTFIPDWSIDVRKIPRFSFIDVIEGRVPASALAGKRVIVGATAIELGDRYAIPRFGTVPGVVIQALAAESLIQQRALNRSGTLPSFAGLILIGLLLARGFNRWRRGLPLIGFAVILALLGVPLLVQARTPLSIDTAPLLLAAVAGILARAIVEARHRIRIAAMHDPETGLPNARALEAALEGGFSGNLTAGSIERFETIRGAIGTAAVGEMMVKASARIAEFAEVTVYRLAPDMLAWTSRDAANAEKLAAEITNLFAEPVITLSGPIDVQWTFGLASASSEGGSSTIEQALAAVNAARADGCGLSWFRDAPSNAVRDLSMMGDLRRGIESGQLFVVYQPKLSLKAVHIGDAEALVRWQHPSEGLIAPDRFLPLAEETGTVREITRFVLHRVLSDLAAPDNSALRASINVSAADIGDASFADEVIRAVSASGVTPDRLTLEITESAIIRSKNTALQVLERLREHGVKLSIDDYGTGQSTLSYVRTLPINELKIDKTFVTSLRDNQGDRIMVRSTIDLAHALGLTVVAEGVEDWDTAKLLCDLGCDYAQGFAIGRGLSIEEFRSMAATPVRKAA